MDLRYGIGIVLFYYLPTYIAGAKVSFAHFYFTYFLKFSNEFLRLQAPVSSHNS
jgi:hypothetical protein